jgi:hypothetical protein
MRPDPCLVSCTPQARTLGPWSSAVELVNARRAAIDERNSKLQQQAEQQGGYLELCCVMNWPVQMQCQLRACLRTALVVCTWGCGRKGPLSDLLEVMAPLVPAFAAQLGGVFSSA